MCPSCFGADMLLEEMSGDGKLIAFTTVHIAPTAMIEAGYGRQNPYCVGVVRLAEGPAISAQIVGVDPISPEEIRIGTPGPGYLYRQRRRRGRHEIPRFRTARLEPPSNAPPVLMGV